MKFRLSFEKKIISVKHLTETTVWLATLDSVGARVFFYNPTVRPRIDLISYGTRVFFFVASPSAWRIDCGCFVQLSVQQCQRQIGYLC